MSRQLPVPMRGDQPARAVRPDVIVLDPRSSRAQPHPLARLAVDLAPDLFRLVDRSLAQRRRQSAAAPAATERRIYQSTVTFSETEYDLRMPFVRKVTVRRASAWAADTPLLEVIEPARRGGRLRRAGLVGAGAVALAALGLLANRTPGLGTRRGWR